MDTECEPRGPSVALIPLSLQTYLYLSKKEYGVWITDEAGNRQLNGQSCEW